MPKPFEIHLVEELISARVEQHGGLRGAPRKITGYRVGESINRSAIVMLSALLQVYIEEIFLECSKKLLLNIKTEEDVKIYRNTWSRWGNPSPSNIKLLFCRIGLPDVFGHEKWQDKNGKRMLKFVNDLNILRNQIAHGELDLYLDKSKFSLSLKRVRTFKGIISTFAPDFAKHVELQLQQ